MKIKYPLFFLLCIFCIPILAQDDWKLKKEEKQIKVWTKKTSDSKYHTFKAQKDFPASLENILAVFLDVENIDKYYETIKRAYDVEEINEMEANYYLEFDFPWPVSDRIAKVYSKIYLKPDGIVEVHSETIPFDRDRGKFVVISKMQSIWQLTPVEKNKTEVQLVGHLDPSGSIPAWIANKNVVDSPFKALIDLEKRLSLYEEVKIPYLH